MSQGHNNNIDDLFRKQLRDHEVKPAPQVWSSLVDDLPVYTPIHKRASFYVASLICTALVSSLLTWYLLSPSLNSATNSPTIPTTNISEQVIAQNSNTLPLSLQTTNVLAPLANTNTAKSTKDDIVNTPKNNNRKAVSNHTSFTRPNTTTIANEAVVSKTNKPTNHYIPLLVPTLASNIASEAFPTTLAQVAASTQAKLPFAIPYLANTSISTAPASSVGAIAITKKPTETANLGSKRLAIQSAKPIATPIIVNMIEASNKAKNRPAPAVVTLDLEVEPVSPLTKEPSPSFIKAKEQASQTHNKKATSSSKPTVPHRLLSNVAPSKDLYFGFVGAMNNTRLLTDKQRPLYSKALTFSPAYGFKLGYDFSKDFGIQAEWILRSTLGQNYTYYPAHSREEKKQELQLTYSQFPVTLKYRKYHFSSLTNQPVVVNYTAGVQYGMLKSAHLPTNNSRLVDDIYKNGNWGFVLGVDYDIYFNKNYFLSLGARSTLSTAANSFTDVQIPTAQTSNHLLFGVHMGLNYRFNQ